MSAFLGASIVKANPTISELAAEITARQSAGRESPRFTLFLGEGCARAAGVPSPVEMARELFASLEGHELTERYVPAETPTDAQLLEGFRRLLSELPEGQRGSLLLQFYGALPVPLFYQELAMLVSSGYFTQILTTNLDALLERALQNAGLRAEQEYSVVLLDREGSAAQMSARGGSQVTIVKLHGDPAGRFALSPDEIEETLKPMRKAVKGALRQDLVMVGYELESPPVTEWLAYVPGELWWVAEERPPADAVSAIDRVRDIRYVDGPSGNPLGFFGGLSMRLLQMPTVNFLEAPAETLKAPGSSEGLPDTTPPDDDAEFEREFVRGQLRRAEELLRRLEQQVAAGTTNERLERQLAYQKDVVAELEARFRTVGDDRSRVLGLLDAISGAAEKAEGPDTTAAFLRQQVDAARSQYGSSHPDEAVVSAVIGATLVIGDRLGVDRGLLRELAQFAPSLTRSSL